MEKNIHSFYCQELFVGTGLRMANEDNLFQISHDLHWPLVGFALLQKSIFSAYQYIGYSEWLWSWKCMNSIHSRDPMTFSLEQNILVVSRQDFILYRELHQV